MIFVPKDYQNLGISHLINNPRAALFAGMGLGKSAMTLAALDHKFKDFQIHGALIVAPKRVITLTWPDEFAKWDQFTWMKYADLRTKAGRESLERGSSHVYGINYESLPKIIREFFKGKKQLPFNCIIFDEITKLKNHKSIRAKAIQQYIHKFDHRIGLTGTPNPNNLLELFAQIRMLDDGERFGKSFNRFKEAHFEATDYMKYNWIPKEDTKEWIYEKIDDLCLPLRTEDHTEVLDTYTEEVEVPIPEEAKKVYEDLSKDLYAYIVEEDAEVIAPNAAVLTNKLLQVAGGAIYYHEDDGTRKATVLHDARIKALKALVKRLREPCIIACNYIHERERILEALPEARAWTDIKDERAFIDDWNAGKIPLIVANPKSIGHGLNLQRGGRTIIWFSLTWSREDFDQFNARLARHGQKQRPQVFILLAPNSLDEVVMETLKNRLEGQTALFQGLKYFRRLREAL